MTVREERDFMEGGEMSQALMKKEMTQQLEGWLATAPGAETDETQWVTASPLRTAQQTVSIAMSFPLSQVLQSRVLSQDGGFICSVLYPS